MIRKLAFSFGLLSACAVTFGQTAPKDNPPFQMVLASRAVKSDLQFTIQSRSWAGFAWILPDWADYAYYGTELWEADLPSPVTGTAYLIIYAKNGADGTSPASGEVGELYPYNQNVLYVAGTVNGGGG